MTDVRPVLTAFGEARLHVDAADDPLATVVLGHGAGRGHDSPDLQALARDLPSSGVTVCRLEQPWHVAGRKLAPRPATLDVVTTDCLAALGPVPPLVLGGRSAGARTGCRLAASAGAVGCVALAFPLFPPGRPGVTRLAELESAGVPTLVVQGERDAFGGPDAFPPSVELAAIPDADHGFRVLRQAALSQEETYALVVEAVLEWVIARAG